VRRSTRFLFFAVVVLCFQCRVWAFYGDPGSGTLAWQLMGAALFGFMFYVRRILNWISSLTGRKNGDRQTQ
jgi:hypothetical protein